MTTLIKTADFIESVYEAIQYISYYHPKDFLKAMKHAYDIIKIPDQEVAKNRKTLDNQDKIRGSILASTGYMAIVLYVRIPVL